jgi:glycine oxidase
LFHGDAERELSTLVALHHGLGLSCEPISIEEAQAMEPAIGRDARAAAFLPEEGSVDTRALAAAVLAAAESAGATLRPGVEVTSLVQHGNHCSGVRTADGETFVTKHVVLAAGSWTSQLKQAARYAPTKPVRGQMVALLNSDKRIHSVLRSEHGYIVPRDQVSPQKLVAGSTLEQVGYEKAVTSGGLEKILATLNEIAPGLAGAEIVETWCGLRPGTPDQLPILGPTDVEGLLIATGHYCNGILLAPITSKLIAECITDGKPSMDLKEFSPLRFLSEDFDRSAAASQ